MIVAYLLRSVCLSLGLLMLHFPDEWSFHSKLSLYYFLVIVLVNFFFAF